MAGPSSATSTRTPTTSPSYSWRSSCCSSAMTGASSRWSWHWHVCPRRWAPRQRRVRRTDLGARGEPRRRRLLAQLGHVSPDRRRWRQSRAVSCPGADRQRWKRPPLEQVQFIRDEMANMVWAIEQRVASRLGEGIVLANGSTAPRRPLPPRRRDTSWERPCLTTGGPSYRCMFPARFEVSGCSGRACRARFESRRPKCCGPATPMGTTSSKKKKCRAPDASSSARSSARDGTMARPSCGWDDDRRRGEAKDPAGWPSITSWNVGKGDIV